MKERVNVSTRPLHDGVQSLFLDYRIAGKRKRENLKLYIYPGNSATDRAKNAETMRIAKARRDQKEFELEQMEAGVQVQARPRLMTFNEYLPRFNELSASQTTKNNVAYAINGEGDVLLQDMTAQWFMKFCKLLDSRGFKANTIRYYCQLIKTVLGKAQTDGLIQSVPKTSDAIPRAEQSMRVFLTIDELRKLAATPCKRADVKRAFLFCCYTGLRISDAKKLRQSDIVNDVIVIRQTKTKDPVRVPLNTSAKALLEDGGLPFNIHNEVTINKDIRRWVKLAGIDKHVTYHCSRHTFATLSITSGVDIYTVSKLLGHQNVNTTQVYAKCVDEVKKKAVDLIPNL